jgi:hypothetical protein
MSSSGSSSQRGPPPHILRGDAASIHFAMNTSRAGSRSGCAARQARLARATSARS